MYAPPNPKKLAYLKTQADALLAEAEKQRQIELEYARYAPTQVHYEREMRAA